MSPMSLKAYCNDCNDNFKYIGHRKIAIKIHKFKALSRNYAETVPFQKFSTPGN